MGVFDVFNNFAFEEGSDNYYIFLFDEIGHLLMDVCMKPLIFVEIVNYVIRFYDQQLADTVDLTVWQIVQTNSVSLQVS